MLNSEVFVVKEEGEGIEFDVPKRPVLGFQEECHSAAPEREGEKVDEDEAKEEVRNRAVTGNTTLLPLTEGKEDAAVSEESGDTGEPPLGEFETTDVGEDDEGLRTPTSLDHRIPVVKECPPAPRKPKPIPSRKRKASPNARRRLQPLDVTGEVESLFSKPDFHRNIKRARGEENQ